PLDGSVGIAADETHRIPRLRPGRVVAPRQHRRDIGNRRHVPATSRSKAGRTQPARSIQSMCPRPATTSTQAPGIRSAASVLTDTGIGLPPPATNPTGTPMLGNAAASPGIAATNDSHRPEYAVTDSFMSSGIGGA